MYDKNRFVVGHKAREKVTLTDDMYRNFLLLLLLFFFFSDIALKSTRFKEKLKQKEASEQEEPRSRASRSLQLQDFLTTNSYVTFYTVTLSCNAFSQALVRHACFFSLNKSSLTSLETSAMENSV